MKCMFFLSHDIINALRKYLKLFEDKDLHNVCVENVTIAKKDVVNVCLQLI